MNQDSKEITRLIHACLDGCETEEQSTCLNARLRMDPATRDLYLELADMHSCLAVDESLWCESTVGSGGSKQGELARPRLFAWRPLAAAAAGILLGMFCTSVVFAYVGPSLGKSKVVFSESFEASAAQTEPGLPRTAGLWGGDEAAVVSSSPEVKPRSGGKMLRILSATHRGENSQRSQWGDMYRIVDVRKLVGAGRTVARVSTYFAQGKGSGEERYACRVGAFALDQDLSTLPSPLNHLWLQQNNSAAGSRRAALTDTGRWQEVSVELPITNATRYVVLHLAVVQEEPALTSGIVEFPAHYMDDVKVELITRP